MKKIWLTTKKKNWGRLFFQKPFFRKFVVTPPPEVLGDEKTNWGVYSNKLG